MVVIAGKKFTTYPRPGVLTGDEQILLEQGDDTKTAVLQDVLDYVENQVTTVSYTPSGFYDIAGSVEGKPAEEAVVMRFVAVRPFRLPTDFIESQASTYSTATADATFHVRKNGLSVGTFTFLAGERFAVWDKPEYTDFEIRDVFTVTAPSTQDATLADAEITIVTYLEDPTVVIE